MAKIVGVIQGNSSPWRSAHNVPLGAAFLSLLVLLGCTNKAPDEDLASCQVDLAKLPHLDTDNVRFSFVDNCMVSKGWKAPVSCVKGQLQGMSICFYEKK